MIEGINLAIDRSVMNRFADIIVYTHFNDVENNPLSCLIVSAHAVTTSLIKATSISGFSEIIQLQTSIPADIAEGVPTSTGKTTR
jgi:hypothetical protein